MEAPLSPTATAPTAEPFFGLVELDPAGTIVYSRLENKAADRGGPAVDGQNFFTDLRPVSNVEDFRELMCQFAHSSVSASHYDFECRAGANGNYAARVSISRICERSDGRITKSFLVHFKPVP